MRNTVSYQGYVEQTYSDIDRLWNDWSLTASMLLREESNWEQMMNLKQALRNYFRESKEASTPKRNLLTKRQMEILIMYYFKKMTQQEIADKLGNTKQSVSESLHWAKAKIKKNMQNIV